MVLLKEKNGKYVPAREPLSLDKCVVCMDPDFDEVFEVHEINKETLFFKVGHRDRPPLGRFILI